MNKQELQLVESILAKKRRFAKWWLDTNGQEILNDLEEHFQVNFPVFQGSAGHFDPLDAMRRDAYREVFLYIRNQIKIIQQDDNQ